VISVRKWALLYVACTIHIWGLMPPHINQLPMATVPHYFLHYKQLDEGNTVTVLEEGTDNYNVQTSFTFQKYYQKKQEWPYVGFDHRVKMKNDRFLESIGVEEKQKYDERMRQMWKDMNYNEEDAFFMIQEGTKLQEDGTVKSKVALYQDKDEFERARDESFDGQLLEATNHERGWSVKGTMFYDLQSAKNYVQSAREEEGVHWNWPGTIPVYWKKGPLSHADVEKLPAWKMYYQEAFEDGEGAADMVAAFEE